MTSFFNKKSQRADRPVKPVFSLYDFFYYIGTFFLRSSSRFFRSCGKHFRQMGKSVRSHAALLGTFFKRGFSFVYEEIVGLIFAVVYCPYSFFKKLHLARKANGFGFMLRTAKNMIVHGYRSFFKQIRVLLCYALPIAAFFFLLNTISGFTDMDYAVAVSYDGQLLGYVADEAVYNNAEKLVQDRIIYDNQEPIRFSSKLTVAPLASNQKLSDEFEICNRLIEATGEEITEAYGLYVDENFFGATTNGAALAQALQNMLTLYSSGVENEKVSFVNDVQVKEGLYPESSIVDYGELEALLHSETEGKRTYIIQSGDSPIRIAQKNGIPVSQLRVLNPDIDKNCMIGDEVLIANSKPFLTVKTAYTDTYEVPLKYKTISTSSNKYQKGSTKVVVAGKDGVALETAEKVYIDGVLSETNVLSTVTIREPVNREVIIGTYVNTTASTGSGTYSGKFRWPVDGGYVSCGINGYSGHTGMDIAAARGTNIRASMSGRVITVKYQNYGYGYHIIIDHGNGVQTLYGHCSKLLVNVGDYVNQGDIIAKVGTTGNSTGNHCHFEIRINKRYMNPANYIGTKYNR